MNSEQQIAEVSSYLKELQDSICAGLSQIDGNEFVEDIWQHENGRGGGRTRVLVGGDVIEKGGVNFSHVIGESLPPAATAKRPELTGKSFQAMGVSLVIHPNNPFAPTSHANVRFFIAGSNSENPVWWFGGGFDMTPYYGFTEDALHWHQTAKEACAPFGEQIYPDFKKQCDDYFYLPHRKEQRGIGGLFFDDLNASGFNNSFAITRSIGDHYLPAYAPILQRRKDTPYTQAERDWQLLRRGRYVEFNLVYDRGTIFGLQSGGRTESILMSLPPQVAWDYMSEPESGSAEDVLLNEFLPPKDWLK